jgi:hypothetical protein
MFGYRRGGFIFVDFGLKKLYLSFTNGCGMVGWDWGEIGMGGAWSVEIERERETPISEGWRHLADLRAFVV